MIQVIDGKNSGLFKLSSLHVCSPSWIASRLLATMFIIYREDNCFIYSIERSCANDLEYSGEKNGVNSAKYLFD